MKKIFSLVFASIFAFSLTAFAQDDNVRFDKTIKGPDSKGVYTISLEAYVTGAVTVTESPAPADIVLVLDRSGSMAWSLGGSSSNVAAQNQRINILKNAVRGFVETVQASNNKIAAADKDTFGGHRIAIVWFSSSVSTGTGLNQFINVENLTTQAASGTGYNYSAARVNYNNTNLLNVSANGGTETDDAMVGAQNVLNGVSYPADSKRTRVVVFFTDGQPGNGQSGDNWMGQQHDLQTANGCINTANTIKNSTKYGATIYSVGLFNKADGTKDATTTYLSYTSSDYTDKTEMPANNNANFVPVSNVYSIVVSSADGLANVFNNIANSSTPNTSAASSSSVLVDIVSTSFEIQADADLGNAKVYQVENVQTSNANLVWEARSGWEDITNKQGISFVSNPSTGTVSVSGFDYGAEWCGWDASWENESGVRVGKAHGSKLVLEIPIMANEDALGGPDIATNGPGSKLTIKDKDGKTVSEHEFVSPVISLPVNIHIMKKGLKAGESAKFTIRRTTLPITNSSVWDYVSSVFVTNGSPSKFEDFEEADGTVSSYPVTYVRGLPSVVQGGSSGEHIEYVYRIDEEDWGWNYDFVKVTGEGIVSVNEETNVVTTGPITISDKDAVYSNKFVGNPIVFWNNREANADSKVRNAESKATNIFSNGGTVIYVDSKKNTGTGR